LLIVAAGGPNDGQGQGETGNDDNGWPPAWRLGLGVVFLGFHLESAETLQTTARWPSQ
jgi:hypothetical protein